MNSDLLTILVAITALATFALWYDTNRPKFKQLDKKFRKALWESSPIEPKHNKPKSEPHDEWEGKFFYEFDDFADAINWYLADDSRAPGACKNYQTPMSARRRPGRCQDELTRYSTIRSKWETLKSMGTVSMGEKRERDRYAPKTRLGSITGLRRCGGVPQWYRHARCRPGPAKNTNALLPKMP